MTFQRSEHSVDYGGLNSSLAVAAFSSRTLDHCELSELARAFQHELISELAGNVAMWVSIITSTIVHTCKLAIPRQQIAHEVQYMAGVRR